MEPPSYLRGGEDTRRRSSSREGLDGPLGGAEEGGGMGVQGHLTALVLEAGRSQVKSAIDSYGRIDLFRPYFDVEPRKVRQRLLHSLIPRKPSSIQPPTDLYGPLMLILTLVALLLFSMKASGYTLQDGTLMGTALVTCFAYWGLATTGISALAYVYNTDVPSLVIGSSLGYALFGHCLIVFLTGLFHPVHSHLFFYGLTALLAVPSAARLSLYLAYKTKDPGHKAVIAGFAALLHLSFLLYLHFGFHATLEEIELVVHHLPLETATKIEELMGEGTHMAVGEKFVTERLAAAAQATVI